MQERERPRGRGNLECIADVILHVMTGLLSGEIPHPTLIARVLTAVQEGRDIYAPDPLALDCCCERSHPPPCSVAALHKGGDIPSDTNWQLRPRGPDARDQQQQQHGFMDLKGPLLPHDEGAFGSAFGTEDAPEHSALNITADSSLDEALIRIFRMTSTSSIPEPGQLTRSQSSSWCGSQKLSRVSLAGGPAAFMPPSYSAMYRSQPGLMSSSGDQWLPLPSMSSCDKWMSPFVPLPSEHPAPGMPRAWSTQHIFGSSSPDQYPMLRTSSSISSRASSCHMRPGMPWMHWTPQQMQLSGECPLNLSKVEMEEVHKGLAAAEEWQWDVFQFERTTQGHALSVLSYYLFHQADLVKHFNLDPDRLARFLRRIEEGYKPNNPYHNATHAADVLHSMHVLLHKGGLVPQYVAPGSITLLACYVAAIVHDYEHLGVTNDFLIGTGDPLAVMYNDKLPMENFHIAAAFSVLSDPDYNFMQSLSDAEFTKLRKLVIELVLATDMKGHVGLMGQFSSQFNVPRLSLPGAGCSPDGAHDNRHPALTLESLDSAAEATSVPQVLDPANDSQVTLALQLAIKCSDLGHSSSSWTAHLQWVDRLQEELYMQGDLERANQRPLSQMCDRMDSAGPARFRSGQVGFFDQVVLPLLWAFRQAFPRSAQALSHALSNRNQWAALAEQSREHIPEESIS